MGKERLFRLVFIFIHLSLFVFHKYHPFLFTAQPLPWGGLCAAASLRPNVSGEILLYFIPPINSGMRTFQTFNSGKHSKHSINAGELQETCDERGQPGEGHLHLAGQRRQERCWRRLRQVSHLKISSNGLSLTFVKLRQKQSMHYTKLDI